MSTTQDAPPTPKVSLEDMGQELFEKLLDKQEECFENIKTLIRNYKKDSEQRKTSTYLQTRLDKLEAYWAEFMSNHKELKKNPIKEDKYFKYDVFDITRDMYTKMEEMLVAKLQILQNVPESHNEESQGRNKDSQGRPEAETDKPSRNRFNWEDELEEELTSGPASTGLKADYLKLLRQQSLNLTAFRRTVSKINVAGITEKWELEDGLQTLKAKWDPIDKIHWELEFELKGSQRQQYKEEYERAENLYDRLKRKLNEKIWATAHYHKTTPKMEIPEFNGNYNQWASFHDLFLQTIDQNPLLSKSQKMQHLKTKLTGEAGKLIQHLTISAENYDSAMRILEHRYENKRLLFSSYMNALLNLPTIQQPSAQNLKKLHDTLLECLNGLQNLGLEVQTWDPIFVHLLLPKLDSTTYADYIHDLESPRELPNLTEFIEFLETKFMAFEAVKQCQSSLKPTTSQQNPPQRSNNNFNERGSMNFKNSQKWPKSYHTTVGNCPLCNKAHSLMRCDSFLTLNAINRKETVAKLQICKNCLFSHGGQQCKSSKTCKTCGKAHHTLLHDDLHNETEKGSSTQPPPSASNHVNSNNQEVLLTTAQLKVKNSEGNYITLRALLDQGSQVSLVTENAAQRLRLPRRKINAVVSGVGNALGNCKGVITLECKSIHSDFTFETEALIMKKLMNNLPNTKLVTKWEHLQNLKLADPEYNVRGPIDILLGTDIYSRIIEEGVLRRDPSSPVAQHTKIGWILSGGVKTFKCFVTLNELDWESEEISSSSGPTDTEELCEQHYVATTERKSTGQYIVKLPLKSDLEENLGNSKPQAIAQFLQLERKMARQENFAKLYKAFMREYIELGHMTPAPPNAANKKPEAYLPYHGVLRERSTTTKLRTLFNASMPTSTNYSLNNLMEKGPNIEKEWDIIRSELIYLKSMKIPRWINVTHSQSLELHRFSDASEKAYACVVYSRTINENGQYIVTQLAAKTKVEPAKTKTTLPRLELCGAHLLAKLIEKIKLNLADNILRITCLTDSQVVLAWIQGKNARWERYITHRTDQITKVVPAKQWLYVKTKENPADCATRGLLPTQILTFNLWWRAPDFLRNWQENEKSRVLKCFAIKTQTYIGSEICKQLIERCSDLMRVMQCIVWVLCFKTLSRHEPRSAKANLTLSEIDDGPTPLIISNQHGCFCDDIGNILKRPVTKLSPLPRNKFEGKVANCNEDESSTNEHAPNNKVPPVTRSLSAGATPGSYVAMLLFILCTLMTTCAQSVSDFKLTTIEGNRPIYFDEIGDLQMIHDEWTLLIYYNISTYWQGMDQITRYTDKLDDICKRMEKQSCRPAIAQLKHELQQLDDYNDLLLSPHLSRKKRGYVNGIGSLARTLFGVLDEEFAKKYELDIQKIQKNENYLLDLIKNQTSIIETENDIIKKNDKFMKQQFESIHEYIKRTNDSMNQIIYKVELMAAMNDFNAASLTAALVITNLKRTQDMLLNTLTNLHNGHLDVHLVTPKQLIYQLHIIAAKVAKGLSLPVKDNDIEANIRDIYQLLYVRARITTTYLLLEVHIPLTRDDEYKIYRPIALPMNVVNNHYSSVILDSTYIAVYLKNNVYLTLNDKDLDHCVQPKEGRFVCNTNYPIKSLRSERASCEAQAFNQQTLRCDTRSRNCIDNWFKLKNPNRWIYLCCNSCQARILCEGNRLSAAKLANTGILDLNEGCVLQDKDTTIFAYSHFGNKLNMDLDISQLNDANVQFNGLLPFNSSDVQLSPPSDQEETYRDIEARLKLLKTNEKLPEPDLTSHDIHQFSVLYLVVGGLLVALLNYAVKRCKGRKNNNTDKQQQPKQTRKPNNKEVQPKTSQRFNLENIEDV